MQQRVYRAWPSPALLAALFAVLAVAVASSVLAGELRIWLLVTYGMAVVGLAVELVKTCRWRLVADDRGISVDSGFGTTRRVGWREVEAVRTWPPAVRPRSGRRLRVLLKPEQLRELERVAADAQGEPEGALLEGPERFEPTRSYALSGGGRFLAVTLLGVVVATLLHILTDGAARMAAAALGVDEGNLRWISALVPLGYLAFLLFARSRRTLLVGSLVLIGSIGAVAAGLWFAGFEPAYAVAPRLLR